jgi:lipopolysaccharide/colanic/teichoic acid biosynthesis glycosyltransferase
MQYDDRTVIFRSDRPGSRQETSRRVSPSMDTAPLNASYPAAPTSLEVSSSEGSWGVSQMGLSLTSPHVRLYRAEEVGFTIGMVAKRLVDVTGSAIGLILLSPVFFLIAILIKSDSPGPVFFRQRRSGRNGRPFQIWKFRTMYQDAEARVHELEERNQAAGGVLFKIEDDPRITKLGAILRRTHLDEFPQLINVLKGEMSLVGPRPLQGRDSDRLLKIDPVAFHRRLELPPGITGAWQVGRANPIDSENLVHFDLDYIENWTLSRDLYLIARTMWMVFEELIGRKLY